MSHGPCVHIVYKVTLFIGAKNWDWKTKIYYSPSPTELSCPPHPPPPYWNLAHLVWRESTFETENPKRFKSLVLDTCPVVVDLNMESSLRVRRREEEHLSSKASQNILSFCKEIVVADHNRRKVEMITRRLDTAFIPITSSLTLPLSLFPQRLQMWGS